LTVTLTLVFRDRVLGAVPEVPVTITVKLAAPVQVTDKRPLALTVAVQPAGWVDVTEKVTVPVKPLIAFTVTCEVPAVFALVVIAGAERVKSWTVTSTPTVRVIDPLVPCTVTVNGVTPVEQVTDNKPVALTVAVQPAG
jgi:hypothetical protein